VKLSWEKEMENGKWAKKSWKTVEQKGERHTKCK